MAQTMTLTTMFNDGPYKGKPLNIVMGLDLTYVQVCEREGTINLDMTARRHFEHLVTDRRMGLIEKKEVKQEEIVKEEITMDDPIITDPIISEVPILTEDQEKALLNAAKEIRSNLDDTALIDILGTTIELDPNDRGFGNTENEGAEVSVTQEEKQSDEQLKDSTDPKVPITGKEVSDMKETTDFIEDNLKGIVEIPGNDTKEDIITSGTSDQQNDLELDVQDLLNKAETEEGAQVDNLNVSEEGDVTVTTESGSEITIPSESVVTASENIQTEQLKEQPKNKGGRKKNE